jgi:hypothetical protein
VLLRGFWCLFQSSSRHSQELGRNVHDQSQAPSILDRSKIGQLLFAEGGLLAGLNDNLQEWHGHEKSQVELALEYRGVGQDHLPY